MNTPATNQQENGDQGFLLGRLFVVPLIIVLVVLACILVVVLSFGAISNAKQKPLTQLLAELERPVGQKPVRGMLLPRDKEMWQAGQELAMRLEFLEDEISEEQLPELQQRLQQLIERDLADFAGLHEMGQQRLFFVMRAAAKTRAAGVIPVYIECLDHSDERVRREALMALAAMRDTPGARDALLPVAERLQDDSAVVQMVACAALTELAGGGDRAVIDRLANAFRHSATTLEVRWNIALTLARLGDDSCPEAQALLQEMLQRSYWERQRAAPSSGGGPQAHRGLTAAQVEKYLMVSIDAGSNLHDPEVWRQLEELTRDSSLAVSGRARRAIDDRTVGDS